MGNSPLEPTIVNNEMVLFQSECGTILGYNLFAQEEAKRDEQNFILA